MIEGQSWKIIGYVTELYILHGAVKGKIEWIAENGSNQHREFRAAGKLADEISDMDFSNKLVKLSGYHDFKNKDGTYYTVMVVQKVEFE